MSTGTSLGVNAAGFLRGGLGLGQAARLYVQALHTAGVPVRTTTLDLDLPDVVGPDGTSAQVKTTDFADLHVDGELPFNLVCVNAPELPGFHRDLGEAFFEGRYTIGVWAWEVDVVPSSWDESFALVDEIWVYAKYVQEIFERVSPVPVIRMPLPIVAPPPGGDVRPLKIPDGFTFLFLFDFYSTQARKNPDGLIEAFKRAFEPGEGPQLVLKSHNGDFKPERLARVQDAIAGREDIVLLDRFLSEPDMAALMRRADCYVSLHRAEGFGLTLGEAMALGKPVIGTGWSANLDFMTEENSYLVRHTLTEVGAEGENYPANGTWAEPDLDHAAQLMRRVWENQEEAKAKGLRARNDIVEGFSLESVGEQARDRLVRLTSVHRRTAKNRTPGDGGVLPNFLPPGSYVESAERMQTWDPVRNAAEVGGAKGVIRRAALQAMRPYTAHQDELNKVVAAALREIDDRLEELVSETQRRHVQMQNVTWALNDLRLLLAGLHARPASTHPAISQTDANGRRVLRFENPDPEQAGVFEDIFRGDERTIRERQAVYVEDFVGRDWVLDLGCGRGEFLELLRDDGIAGRGVDPDAGMVERCLAKGLDVAQASAAEHLAGLEDGSVPAIFLAQVVEHLEPMALRALLAAIAGKLVPGGIAVLETVNPHNPAAMKSFWADPTHHHPLFPEVLLALARLAGFAEGEVRFPTGTGVFDDDVYTARDFSVLLRAA